jgi:uncharacterized repeat protein (TIGR03803 family)
MSTPQIEEPVFTAVLGRKEMSMKWFGFRTLACTLTLFCIATAPASHGQTFTSLLHFKGTNGSDPGAQLIQGPDGNFYGTTSTGGVSNSACDSQSCGTLFRMTPEGTLTTLYSFCSKTNCNDGASPGQIVLGPDGNIYGATATGGTHCHDLVIIGCGTIFKFTPARSLTTLYSFCPQTNCLDGWNPDSLVLGTDGNFYGTTFHGGLSTSEGLGTFFKVTRAGVFTALHSFCATDCLDGGQPENLTQANGNFLGTTYEGGTDKDSCGIVFEITPAGNVTALHSFNVAQGCFEHSSVILATDGNLYGANSDGGGPHRRGMVYQLTPAGEFTDLYSFCVLTDCADGDFPTAGLVQATDGNFYGTTRGALTRPVNDGTVFEITSDGTMTTLYSFNSVPQAASGAFPVASLLQATDGSFYGTTSSGGRGYGTAFKVSTGLSPFVAANQSFGKTGGDVMILGNNLTGTTSVTFNGVSAVFQVVSSTFIKATVPSGATTGTIQVTTQSGTLSSNVVFQVLP